MSNGNDEIYIVDGFEFVTEKEAELARKEVEGVRYIREKTDMKNPEMVLRIYNKMIEEGLFETAVGVSYLKEVQDYLNQVPFLKKEEILPIPVLYWNPGSASQPGKEKESRETTEKTEKTGGKNRLKVSLVFNLILMVCIVAMFWISTTSSSPTILNYETKLIDRYAAWEQELTEREQAVREREQILGITPDTW